MRWLMLTIVGALVTWAAVSWKKSASGESCMAAFNCAEGLSCVERRCAGPPEQAPPVAQQQLNHAPMVPRARLGAARRDPSAAIGNQLRQNLAR